MIYVKGADGKAKVVSAHLTDGELYYDKGKQDEYDRFWDLYQQNGERVNYRNAFAGYGWTADTFKPKYKMIPTGIYDALSMFSLCNVTAVGAENALDYRKFAHLLDFSQAAETNGTFYSARINYIDVDFSNSKNLQNCFSAEWNKTYLTDLTLKVSQKCTNYSNAFIYQVDLTNLTFVEGSVIAASISFNRSPKLTKASLLSIFTALSTTVTGRTVTVHRKAVNKAFETRDGANDGSTSQEWLDLIATRSNWTVSFSDL